MIKKLLLTAIVVTVLLFTVGGYSIYWWKTNTSSPSGNTADVVFVIPKGASAEKIGQNLEQKGLIKSALAFKIYVQLFDQSGNINAGEFMLSPSMTLQEVVEALQGGPLEIWVTIPEGKRREEVVIIIADALGKTNDDRVVFISEFTSITADKEGYLFPDTYLFPPEASAEQVVAKMTNTFELRFKEFENAFVQGKTKQALTKEQVVILASIIERETKTREERPIVAGILIKRLNTQGWLLQADATVEYAIGSIKCTIISEYCDWWPTLTRQDLDIDSLYNSYKYKTFPPTPIANPGLTSLEAAVYPQDSNYWFYIHEDTGQIYYAETLEQHNTNVAKYLGK